MMKKSLRISCLVGMLSFMPAAFSSVLSELAASMQPGTWAELPTIGFDGGNLLFTTRGPAGDPSTKTGTIVDYSETAAWDPVARKLMWIGAPHGNAWKFIMYHEDTNTWTSEPLPHGCMYNGSAQTPGIAANEYCGGHAYDWVTMDQARGLMIRRQHKMGPFLDIYNVNTGVWSRTSEPTGAVLTSWTSIRNTYGSMEYVPELDSIITATGGLMFKIHSATGEWTRLPNQNMGGYHNIMEYNPVYKLTMFGGGNSDTIHEIYKMDAQGIVTKMNNAPFLVRLAGSENGTGPGTLVTVDPVSGRFLVVDVDRKFYEYDIIADKWTLLDSAAPVSAHGAAAVINNYGVVVYITPKSVQVYKHGACANCPSLQIPTAPQGLTITVQ